MNKSSFIYQSRYRTYEDCFFRTGYYENGNLALEIWNTTEGPITKVTVNPDIKLPENCIAIKDYSENEGMVNFLKSNELVVDEPFLTIPSGWVFIPVYMLSDKGKEIFRN